MGSDRMMGVLRLLEGDGWSDGASHAVTEAAHVLEMDGVAVCLSRDGGSALEAMWFSHPLARAFSDLQFTCGQGPSLDSMRHCLVVRVEDLDTVREDRWPALTTSDTGPVRAVFCFPLRIGALRIGVLTLLRTCPGPLAGASNDGADLFARALTRYCLGLDLSGPGTAEGQDAPATGRPAPERDPVPRSAAEGEVPGFLEATEGLARAEVHQATGMLSIQLRIGLADALVRLRAHAYGSGRSLDDVAHAVVTRRLRLGRGDADDDSTTDDAIGEDTPDEKDPPA
ncbi:GAF and ANTAR domain-containing protein [Streptomyces sp. NPDC001941]|uniref:GAF and ANTAR domain-containing protein n=1 Tax=Streptomyces sp. NPDC001941 TaxID=3154659 RepID=UPI003328FAC4